MIMSRICGSITTSGPGNEAAKRLQTIIAPLPCLTFSMVCFCVCFTPDATGCRTAQQFHFCLVNPLNIIFKSLVDLQDVFGKSWKDFWKKNTTQTHSSSLDTQREQIPYKKDVV